MDPLLPLHRYRLAGQLTEIRASDLAFTIAEAGLLLAQHGSMLTADSLESLTRRTEGWAAGLRMAAISLGTHPDPGQFVKELIAEDSALIGYLVDEVLNVQPPEVREVLLSTSILELVSADAAVDLTGDERAAGILMALVRTNAFVQPIGSGWYRYHTLFAEMLRLKLRHEYPDRVAALHQRAARWYERNGLLTDAVRHAAQAGDWQLAASMVIDELAIGQIIEPRGGQCLAEEFAGMPPGRAWTGPQPHLVSAAIALSAGRTASCAAALDAADGMLERLPADQEATGRLAAAVIRLTACPSHRGSDGGGGGRQPGELMLSRVPGGKLARHPDLRRRCAVRPRGRRAVVRPSGRGGPRPRGGVPPRPLPAGSTNKPTGWAAGVGGGFARPAGPRCGAGRPGGRSWPASTGRLADPNPAPLVALAWVHLAAQRVARGTQPASSRRTPRSA